MANKKQIKYDLVGTLQECASYLEIKTKDSDDLYTLTRIIVESDDVDYKYYLYGVFPNGNHKDKKTNRLSHSTKKDD